MKGGKDKYYNPAYAHCPKGPYIPGSCIRGDNWFIVQARYAKGKCAIHCTSDGSGLKTQAMRLASTLKGARYSHREKAYIVSPTQAARFVREWREGLDACVMTGERYKD